MRGNLELANTPTNPCYHSIDTAYDCSMYYKLFNPFFSYVKVLQEVNYIVWIKQDEIKLSNIQQCEACLKLEVLVWKCNKA